MSENKRVIPMALAAAYEERAAIMEYDGNMTREEAEEKAYQDVIGRNKNQCPSDIGE